MPAAKPPLTPTVPCVLEDEEIVFIKQTVHRFYGEAAVIRNFGSDPNHLQLHVEADCEGASERWECLGVLMTRTRRKQISLAVTKRGTKIVREAKLAYRQGAVV
jgi:hypothetical protein